MCATKLSAPDSNKGKEGGRRRRSSDSYKGEGGGVGGAVTVTREG